MPATIRNTILIFVVGFLSLFLLRLGYGYWQYPNGVELPRTVVSSNIQQGWGFASGLKNYASKKIIRKSQTQVTAATGNQKYEKVANIGLQSEKFDNVEESVRDLVKANQALIQFEERTGLKDRRVLRLAIGVNPDNFDSFVSKVQTFGKVTTLTINKSDKTNEYRELKAKRLSLEKARTALTELKQREGKISELIELEQQILNREQEIQQLGVSLGDFDTENEFVTVKLRLAERGKAALRNISIVERVFTAFVWTVKYYAMLWLGLLAAVVTALVAVHLLRLVGNVMKNAELSAGN